MKAPDSTLVILSVQLMIWIHLHRLVQIVEGCYPVHEL